MVIYREITNTLIKLSTQFPVVGIMGPKQSGKTTLAKETFPNYSYVTLEDIDIKLSAKDYPRRFLQSFAQRTGVIIDEIQEVPELFSYMQGIVDQAYKPGFFIVTGSQNFLMYEKITQTLAGRIALLTLLPLAINELQSVTKLPLTAEEIMFKGLYPRIYSQNIEVNSWFSNYIATYAERDVRQLINIGDLTTFQKFLKLCAARIGNLLNYAELARDCDISPNTAKAWISILETSYIIKLLQPYYKNYNKRIIKSPKLYFYDTGLACALLGIKNSEELHSNPIRGALFENLIIMEFFKKYYNAGQRPEIYFWRDVQGHEIDCVIEESFNALIPIEIKSSMTINPRFFKELIDWQKITGHSEKNMYLVYAGDQDYFRAHGQIISWRNLGNIPTLPKP